MLWGARTGTSHVESRRTCERATISQRHSKRGGRRGGRGEG